MDYGLPQDYYNKKFSSKLQRRHRYREFENSYPLGISGVPAPMVMSPFPRIPVGVSLGSLPDAQIFFTEPKIKDVSSYVHRSKNISVNVSGSPSKVDQIKKIVESLSDSDSDSDSD
jgi:hypothetical protein